MIWLLFDLSWASLVTQTIRNLPAIQETWVLSLGWEDTLEKRMATHSSGLACKIPWIEELQSIGHKELDTTERLTLSPDFSWNQKRSTKCALCQMHTHACTHTHTHTHTSKQRSINDKRNSHLELKFSVTFMLTHHIFFYTVEKTRGHRRWHAFWL